MDQSKINEMTNEGLRLHRTGELGEAEKLYRQVLTAQPENPDALHLLGVLARQCGRADAAVELIERAIARFPNCAEYHNHLAEALVDVKQSKRAIAEFSKAIELQPDFAEAHRKRADVLTDSGQFGEAEAGYRQALKLRPEYPEALNNLGIALRKTGRLAEAQEAVRAALRLRPDYGDAYNNLGNIFFDGRRLAEAAEAFAREAELNPRSPLAHNNVGTAMEHLGRLDEAAAAYGRAIALAPRSAAAYSNLGNVLRQQALHDESIEALQRAAELMPEKTMLHSNVLYGMHFHPGIEPETILAAHRNWAERFAEPLTSRAAGHKNDRSPVRRLRVGYVSSDFYKHAVGGFLLPLFEKRDRDNFNVVCYSGVTAPDDLTERLRNLADAWHSTVGMSDAALAEMIRGHRIDILVDLNLHSGYNRLLVFARKPAPVQISYLGYPGTTGMSAMDWRLTDPWLDPRGNEGLYVEKSLRLARTYWCYRPAADAGEVGELPARRKGHVTFGCLNNLSKLNDRVLACWAQILARVPGSRLLLHAGEGSHRERVVKLFVERGVGAERVRFVGKVPYAQYFAAYREIDVGLDPFPYTGGTTTCDALWMGAAVVTLAGRSAVQRGGVSLLSNAGFGDWIAQSEAEYVERAVKAAESLNELEELRRTMRDRVRGSPLLDDTGFTRDLEHAYRAAWKAWCAR